MPEGDFQYWCDLLDGVAERANDNTIAMFARVNRQLKPDADVVAAQAIVISGALVAIATQLAYGNAVAAAEFYMRHTAAQPDEEG